MENTGLYPLGRCHLKDVSQLLADCFMQDPLYCQLIPKEDLRKTILPEFFACYLDMAYDFCDMYADGPQLNGIITVFENHSSNKGSRLRYNLSVFRHVIQAGLLLIREDPSLKTAFNFVKGCAYLTSSWEQQIPSEDRIHIDFFAVRPTIRGKGIGHKLMQPVLQYADSHKIMTTLETHNNANVGMYHHYGFKLFESFSKRYTLQQYCMVR